MRECQCSRVPTSTCSPRTGSGATIPLRSGVVVGTGCGECGVCVCDDDDDDDVSVIFVEFRVLSLPFY